MKLCKNKRTKHLWKNLSANLLKEDVFLFHLVRTLNLIIKIKRKKAKEELLFCYLFFLKSLGARMFHFAKKL